MVEFFVILYIVLSFYVITYQVYRIIVLTDLCKEQNDLLQEIYDTLEEVKNENI